MTEDEVLLERAKHLILILDSHIKQGVPMVQAQYIRDVLDVDKPHEPVEVPEPVEVTE